MSAGGLSYDCLRTSRKVTLPSVEMWGKNMNILRDPNRGYFTRRRDRVGQTQSILLSQENSGDRIAENINVYARGVNPMVSVSYDNAGNNSGARTSILQRAPGVKLPLKPDVFHPPVFTQEQLMPLSRQPRNWFYALTNPIVPNIISQMSCPETRSSVHQNINTNNVTSNIQYHLNDTPRESNLQRNTALNMNIKNPQRLYLTNAISDKVQPDFSNLGKNPKNFTNIRQFSTDTGMNGPDKSNIRDIMQSQDNKSINENKLLYNAFSNISGNKNVAEIRDKITHLQNKAVHEAVQNTHVNTNLSSFESELEIEGPTNQLAKAVNQKNYAIPVKTQISNQYPKNNTISTKPTSGMNENPLNVSANTSKISSIQKNSNFVEGFTPQKIIESPLHTDMIHNNSFGYTKQGTVEYFQQNIRPEEKMGSWVVANESLPYRGKDLELTNKPKESLHSHIYTHAMTAPSSTRFWKPVEPISSAVGNVRDQLQLQYEGRKTRTDLQAILPQENMNKELHRNIPLTSSETSKISQFTKNLEFQDITPGKIDQKYKTMLYESRPTAPVSRNSPEMINDTPIKVRDTFSIPVTSSVGHDQYKKGLDVYADSSQRTGIDQLYQVQSAQTNKKYIEQMGELGVRQNNPRSMLMIQNQETVHDRSSFGHDVYANAQSRDGSSYVNPNSASSGYFEALGNSVPKFGRLHENGGEMPINNDFMDVKKKAVHEFMDRYQGDKFHLSSNHLS